MPVSLPGQSCRSIEGQELSGNLFQRSGCVQARGDRRCLRKCPSRKRGRRGSLEGLGPGSKSEFWAIASVPLLARPARDMFPARETRGSAGRLDPRIPCRRSGSFYANCTKLIATKESFGSSPGMVPMAGDFSKERKCASNFTWAIQRRQVQTKRTRSQASSSEQQGCAPRRFQRMGPLRDRYREKSHHCREGTHCQHPESEVDCQDGKISRTCARGFCSCRTKKLDASGVRTSHPGIAHQSLTAS